jgi:iron complex outermembrane recepter protein
MKRSLSALFLSSSTLVLPLTLFAQAQAASAPQRPAVETLEEVIVTARRREENLQSVPVSETVIGSKEIKDLNILSFNQIQDLVPGLQLTPGDTAGIGSTLSLRGVTFDINTSGSATVETYLNDVPIELNYLQQSIYDVGQIEVLKGPQGTLRGRPSPSGSITYTWAQPRMNQFGGTTDVTVSDLGGRNLQAALNIPIIDGKLAIRLAGVLSDTDGDGVRSVSTSTRPFDKSTSYRVSVRFEPTKDFQAVIGYQNIDRHQSSLGSAVFGTGFLGGVGPTNPAKLPANWNGPPIGQFDRLNVAPYPIDGRTRFEIVTAPLDWNVAAHTLTYVGGWKHDNTTQLFAVNGDNFLRAVPWYNGGNYNKNRNWTHELRLLGDKKFGGKVDYVVGGYYGKVDRDLRFPTVPIANGAYGPTNPNPPGGYSVAFPPSTGQPNLRYSSVQEGIRGPAHDEEYSAFANVRWFVLPRTEISAGLRQHVQDISRNLTIYNDGGWATGTQTAAQCVTSTNAAGITTTRVFGATYPGVCDNYLPYRLTLGPLPEKHVEHALLYSFSITQRITDDILVYALTGNSFRAGPAQVIASLNAAIVTNYLNDPTFARAVVLNNEESETYEVGLKSEWFEKRLRFNVSYFRQDFDGFFYQAQLVPYLNWTGPPAIPAVGFTALTLNAVTDVNGVEAEIAGNLTRTWSATARYTYQKGTVTDRLPCQDLDFDGVPDTAPPTPAQLAVLPAAFIAHGVAIALCQQTDVSSRATRWSASIQSEYYHAINDSLDAFIRGQFTIRPENPYVSTLYVVPATNLVNFFFGVRSADRAWEVTASVANAFNTTKFTTQGTTQTTNTVFAPAGTGYYNTALTPRREYSLAVSYGFGSR